MLANQMSNNYVFADYTKLERVITFYKDSTKPNTITRGYVQNKIKTIQSTNSIKHTNTISSILKQDTKFIFN